MVIEAEPLRPATESELREALSFALRYRDGKRHHGGDAIMADITAERLVEFLERSGFVVMKRPPPNLHRTG